MVYKLSHDEVVKICGTCSKFLTDREQCKDDATGELKSLKELHRCKKWDEHFGSACIYQG
jgi:hypothetical protein